MKAETKESAAEKIKEIRAGVAKDKAAKVQDGKDRRRAGQGDPAKEGDAEGPEKAGGQVHWEAPEEMVQVDYTPTKRRTLQTWWRALMHHCLSTCQGRPNPMRGGRAPLPPRRRRIW